MAEYRIIGLASAQDPAQKQGYRIQGLAPQSMQQQQTSIPQDIAQGLAKLGVAAGEKAFQLPSEIGEAGAAIMEHPLSGAARAGGGLLAGLLEGGKQLYNLPLNINTYLGSKGVPLFKQTMGIAEKMKIGDTGLQKAVLGETRPSDQLWMDIGEIAPAVLAPESLTSKVPSVTSKGILKQLAKDKAKQLSVAQKEYGELFSTAAEKGYTHALPTEGVKKQADLILKNSPARFHPAYEKYLADPTIENAHWAQSELGALERYYDKLSSTNPLTPTQHKAAKAVSNARKEIKKAMFQENALGGNPALASRYDNLATKYRENVIPYTRLQELSEVEAGKMRPSTARKRLMKDEEFMIQLANKYPGLNLYSPIMQKLLGYGGASAIGAAGALEARDLLR